MIFFSITLLEEFLVKPELTPPLENSGWSPLGADTLNLLFLYWKPVKLSYLNHNDTKAKDTKKSLLHEEWGQEWNIYFI